MRRFGELPYHLINAGRITDLCDHVLFNYHWLHAKISAVPIEQTLEDFTRAIRVISNYNQTLSKNSGNEEILRQVNKFEKRIYKNLMQAKTLILYEII